MSQVEQLCTFLLNHKQADQALLVAIDGRSGSGKSTLAAAAATYLNEGSLTVVATVIEGDQFFGGGSQETWRTRRAEEKVSGGIDWRRQKEMLIALRKTGRAEWHLFDWAADWDAQPPPRQAEPVTTIAAPITILEGAYSGREELIPYVDLRILVEASEPVRKARLHKREGAVYEQEWTSIWGEAEILYFEKLMPPARFDLVINNS